MALKVAAVEGFVEGPTFSHRLLRQPGSFEGLDPRVEVLPARNPAFSDREDVGVCLIQIHSTPGTAPHHVKHSDNVVSRVHDLHNLGAV